MESIENRNKIGRWAFTLLFIVTVLLIITATHYALKVVIDQNADLKTKVEKYRADTLFQGRFSAMESKTHKLIDSTFKDQDVSNLNHVTDTTIKAMYRLINNDSTIHKQFYIDVIGSLERYRMLKNSLSVKAPRSNRDSLNKEIVNKMSLLQACSTDPAKK